MSRGLADFHQDAFVRNAVLFLQIGFDDARGQINSATDEVVATELIVSAMNARSKSGKLPRQLDRFEASDDVKVTHPLRRGKRRRIIDIRVVRAGKGRPTFEVEAKCLRKSTNTIGDYTGSEGLMLFVEEEYARDAFAAGMIGYVQTDDQVYWRLELERKLGVDQKALRLVGSLVKLAGWPFEETYQTEHRRQSGSVIRVHHFLVPCS